MYFLDVAQSREAIDRMGFDFDVLLSTMADRPGGADVRTSIDINTAVFSGYVTAKQVVDNMGPFASCMLYIHSMGVRIPLENIHLFDRLRKSYGERRPNFLSPGHVFERHDLFDLVSFCELVINYRLEAVLIQHTTRAWVAFTRSEEILFFPDA